MRVLSIFTLLVLFVVATLLVIVSGAATSPTTTNSDNNKNINTDKNIKTQKKQPQQQHSHESVCQRFSKSPALSRLVSASMKYIVNSKNNNGLNNNNNKKEDVMTLAMNIENTACDVSCESQMCSCMGLDFDPSSSSSFCTLRSDDNNNKKAPSSEATTECLRNYKSCKETSLASAPEPHEGMGECNRAVTDLGFAITPETCAHFACAFAEGHHNSVYFPSSSATSEAENNNTKKMKLRLALDAISSCTGSKRKIALSDLDEDIVGPDGKLRKRAGVILNDTPDPMSELISSLLSSVLSSVINSMLGPPPPTPPVQTPAPPTTTVTVTTTTTTTDPPTTYAPQVAPNKELAPGLVQVKFNYSSAGVAKAELQGAIDDFIRSQQAYLAENVPRGAQIQVVVDAVGGDMFQLGFVVTGVSSDTEALKLEAAVAQAVSDAANAKSFKSPDLKNVLSASGRAPVPGQAPDGSSSASSPQYPTLPDPLNPPPPKMEELPIGAVVAGILGGVVVGLAVGGLVAHYFCSKVEVLPLRDRLMPTGDDDDSDEEEEEEDDEDEDEDENNEEDEMMMSPKTSGSSGNNNNGPRNRANSDMNLLPTRGGGGSGRNAPGGGRNPQTDMELLNLANSSPKKNMSSSGSPRNNNMTSGSSRNNNNNSSSNFSPRGGDGGGRSGSSRRPPADEGPRGSSGRRNNGRR